MFADFQIFSHDSEQVLHSYRLTAVFTAEKDYCGDDKFLTFKVWANHSFYSYLLPIRIFSIRIKDMWRTIRSLLLSYSELSRPITLLYNRETLWFVASCLLICHNKTFYYVYDLTVVWVIFPWISWLLFHLLQVSMRFENLVLTFLISSWST